MNSFTPFFGTRYNRELVRLADVVSPPYDVISNEQREAFYEKSDHNVIRLEWSHDDDPYTSAADFLHQWKKEGILQTDSDRYYYAYYQTFNTPEGIQVTRRGVLGRLKVTPYTTGNVLPHEQTLPKAKEDRYRLLEATHTNFSPIFGLIDDETLIFDHSIDSVTASAPLADVDEVLASGQSVRHTLWKISDPAVLTRIENLLKTKAIIIADGHHRYETSVKFASAHPELPGSDTMMVFLANLHGEGSVILPTHRILYGMDGFNQFEVLSALEKEYTVTVHSSREAAMETLNSDSSAWLAIQFPEEPNWVVVADTDHGIAAKEDALKALAVYRLHEDLLKPIVGLSQAQIDNKTNLLYPHTLGELDEMIAKQEYNAAFILKPVTASELLAVTAQGTFMPQKSTYFYPKLLTGLVFHEIDEQR